MEKIRIEINQDEAAEILSMVLSIDGEWRIRKSNDPIVLLADKILEAFPALRRDWNRQVQGSDILEQLIKPEPVDKLEDSHGKDDR
jgi:hypothetical protein